MRESSEKQVQAVRPRGPLDSVVVPPGSKSITNRALLLAALCDGRTVLDGVLDSEDTRIMFSALEQVGLKTSFDTEARRMTIQGAGGGRFPVDRADLYVGNSGTTARFLAAALGFAGGNYRIYGKPRMHQRPIRDLVDALRQLGADIRCENGNDCPPLLVSPRKIDVSEADARPLAATVSGDVSSQYLSALLMAAPLVADRRDVEIHVSGKLVSVPYVDMTLALMDDFGIRVADPFDDSSVFRIVRNAKYRSPGTFNVEPDASAASYFFAAAAVCGGRVWVPGLSNDSLQGDVRFTDCLEKMGCSVRYESNAITVSRDPSAPLRGISVDMNSISDTAQTLGVVALFAEGPTEISNIEHVRFKETDRIADLATELRRFGADVEERRDGLRIVPPEKPVPATVETYDDHRMAMSFAVAGLRLPGVVIRDPGCTAKTFPDFFNVLETLS